MNPISIPGERENYGNFTAPKEAMNDPLWSDNDPWYSNQKNENTCVRHSLAKALCYNKHSYKLCIKPKDMINQLMQVNQVYGAGTAHPLDWNGKVITLTHQETGAVYDCTVSVEERSADQYVNLVGVDMRKVLKSYENLPHKFMHVMAIGNFTPSYMGKLAFNSWGNSHKAIKINDTQESAKFFYAKWTKIVKKDANKRQDEEVNLQQNTGCMSFRLALSIEKKRRLIQ